MKIFAIVEEEYDSDGTFTWSRSEFFKDRDKAKARLRNLVKEERPDYFVTDRLDDDGYIECTTLEMSFEYYIEEIEVIE